jgi:hypothetical protein
MKAASTVLRGPRRSNEPGLPDKAYERNQRQKPLKRSTSSNLTDAGWVVARTRYKAGNSRAVGVSSAGRPHRSTAA